MREPGTRAAKKVAFVIAGMSIGGHEYQARALVDDFALYARVTVFLNREVHLPLFSGAVAEIKVEPNLFLGPGWLPIHIVNGLRKRRKICELLKDYDHIVVCAGSVEAGVRTSVALMRQRNVTLYLPFFYDRRVLWGKVGILYNLLLSGMGVFYKNIITINRLQARLISGFIRLPIAVVPNLIRDVPKAERRGLGRVLCICRLDRQKRVSELLQWLDFPDNPFREVVVIGDGPAHHDIAKVAAQLKYVKAALLGWKSPAEQDELIDGNDILILNSFIEGEPLVVREANARHLIVLARDIPSVRGITAKRNRFDSAETLRLLLDTAAGETLQHRLERSRDEIIRQRRKVVRAFLAEGD
jgi:hypothetical protein